MLRQPVRRRGFVLGAGSLLLLAGCGIPVPQSPQPPRVYLATEVIE